MKKPLYLVEKGNKITVHRDGPSFLVTFHNRAPRRIPAREIDKVVIIGNVRIDANSIILCAENKIPVLFIASDKKEKALALPYNHKLPNHYKEQRLILQSKETILRYKKWIYTRRSIMQIQILKELFNRFSFSEDIGEGNYQFLINSFIKNQPNWIIIKDIVENFLRGVIIGRIIQAGLDHHLGIIHRRVNFGLLLDLSMIFEPEADFQTIKFFQSSKLGIENGQLTEEAIKQIIDRFESRRQNFTKSVEVVIDELFEIIKDVRK
jgi:CRISPR/Cas system-associated endonuclease Cas1